MAAAQPVEQAGQGEADRKGKQDRAPHQQQGPGEPLRDDGDHRCAVADGDAQIQANDPTQIVHVLLPQGAIQAELGQDLGAALRRQATHLFPDQELHGISGQEARQQEVGGDPQPQDQQVAEEARDEVHGADTPGTGMLGRTSDHLWNTPCPGTERQSSNARGRYAQCARG